MKQKFTSTFCLFIIAALVCGKADAQFFNYLPGLSNYIRSNVKADATGLSFSYLIQDSTSAIKTYLLHTDNNGQAQWMKTATNLGDYTVSPDTSVVLTSSRSTSSGNRIAVLQKQDMVGNTLWSKAISASSADVGVGNVTIGPNNMIYATITRSSFLSNTYYSKAAIVAFSQNGQQLWTKYFSSAGLTTDYSPSRTLLAANGDFVMVADIRGSQNTPANGMMITRVSPQGIVRFSKYIDFKTTTHNQLSVTGLVETPSGHFIFGGRLMTDQISTYPNTMWIGRMDSVGTMVQQKVYSGGLDFGEQLHSLRYDNGILYAYLHVYAPFDSVTKSLWIGTMDEQSLAFTAQNATEIEVSNEDPYGNVSNAFCISSNGKPTIAAGFYCQATGKYLPLMQQWSSSLVSSCATRDVVQLLVDSAATYAVTNYTTSNFTLTYSADTTLITLTNVAPITPTSLCNGCVTPNDIGQVLQTDAFSIYPNPSNGHYFIDIEQPLFEAQITIYNNIGVLVYQSKLQDTHQSIDLSAQPIGIYFARVQTIDGRVATAKLIKDK